VSENFDRDPAAAAELIDALTALASEGAAAIVALRSPTLEWRAKADQSPVTAADEAAQGIIVAGLRRLLPGWPIVSEEAEHNAAVPDGRFALVDPLDGTKEFVSGRDDFTVNIALIVDGTPRIGIVGAPAMGTIWRGMVGGRAERLQLAPGAAPSAATERVVIRARSAPPQGLTAAVSRSHLDPDSVAFLGRLKVKDQIGAGSAVKFCRIAEGSADIYPRFGTTCEWDIGAGHAVVLAAGGIVTQTDGGALSYGHHERDFRVPGFIAWGDPAAARDAG
jgi:3'(2'), 5'-bisphosphate nucleotidase